MSFARFKQDYVEIAKKCSVVSESNEDDLVRTVQEYLSSEKVGKWLLIVDNSDDRTILFGEGDGDSIMNSLPQSEEGIILFTTRSKDMSFDLADGNILNLEEMNSAEAMCLLEKSLRQKDLIQDQEAAEGLLNELTYLPLAIAQASSYIVRRSITISKYLSLIRDTEDEMIKLLSRDFQDATPGRGSRSAVAMTWLVSFEMIKREEPAAADILFFISFLENKAIPLSILPRAGSEGDLTHAVGALVGYSFLKSEGGNDMYDMHRLVQQAVKIWMQKDNITSLWRQKTTSHLADIFPWCEWENRSLWREYTPHAIRVLTDTESVSEEQRAALCNKLSLCLVVDGRMSEAIKWISDCFSWSNAYLHGEDPRRVSVQYDLAQIYLANGQSREAIELLEKIVAVNDRVLTENHPHRLKSQRMLGQAHHSNGQIKEAIEILEKVVEIEERVLVEDHLSRLESQLNLAAAYKANGQVTEAIEILEKVVAIGARELAEGHPARLESQHRLARAYKANGQIGEAIEILEKVVAIEERVLVESHPARLMSEHVLARTYLSNGQVKEAIEVLEKIVVIQERVSAEDDLSLLISQADLALAYENHDRLDKAIPLMKHVVEMQKKSLRDDHPERISSATLLNRMLCEVANED